MAMRIQLTPKCVVVAYIP